MLPSLHKGNRTKYSSTLTTYYTASNVISLKIHYINHKEANLHSSKTLRFPNCTLQLLNKSLTLQRHNPYNPNNWKSEMTINSPLYLHLYNIIRLKLLTWVFGLRYPAVQYYGLTKKTLKSVHFPTKWNQR